MAHQQDGSAQVCSRQASADVHRGAASTTAARHQSHDNLCTPAGQALLGRPVKPLSASTSWVSPAAQLAAHPGRLLPGQPLRSSSRRCGI